MSPSEAKGYEPLGRTMWMIPDGYIPPDSSGSLESHESICVLNTGSEDAHLVMTIYFEDREPLEGIEAVIPARRTRHVRTAGLSQKDRRFLPVSLMQLRFTVMFRSLCSTAGWIRHSRSWH